MLPEHYTRNTTNISPPATLKRSEVTAAERREIFRLMSPAQEELRAERIAIMVSEGVPDTEAERFYNGNPALYGMVGGEDEQQSGLW